MLENERVDTRPTGATNGTEEQGKLFEVARFPEQECYRIVSLRELDLGSEQDLTSYCRLLTHPDNREHFSNPPTDSNNLKEKLTRDSTHAYLAENMLGKVVGAGGLNDAQPGEHDHWLVKAAVDPELQGRGLGKQLLVRLIEEAFTTKTSYSTDRAKLVASIIRNVKGWERMPDLLEQLGLRPLHIMLNEVDVYVQEEGRTVKQPTERWEISKNDWMRIRRRKEISQMLQPPTVI
jgi:GNAT superfamily N-acetyltransferase